MILFRRTYGDTPLHLIVSIASFAIAAFAVLQLVDTATFTDVVIWFVGAILVHDIVFFPLYTGLNLVATRPLGAGRTDRPPVRALNHVRVPLVISGILFVIWFPLILQLLSPGGTQPNLTAKTTLPADVYLGRWLLITAALFVVSALIFAVRTARARSGPDAAVADGEGQRTVEPGGKEAHADDPTG